MSFFNQPMSQEQKRLRLRLAMKFLMEGEDLDYIRMKIREIFPANLSQQDLKGVALNIAKLPAVDRDALVKDIAPDRFDNRHFQAAILEDARRTTAAEDRAQTQEAKRSERAAKLERAGAASQRARQKWRYRLDRLKFWCKVVFWTSLVALVCYMALVA